MNIITLSLMVCRTEIPVRPCMERTQVCLEEMMYVSPELTDKDALILCLIAER